MTMRSLRWALLGLLAACGVAAAQGPVPNPDIDPDRLDWSRIQTSLGPPPDVRGQHFGVVTKTQTNEYWRLVAEGFRRRADADGVKLNIQAAQTESDKDRQLSIMETMVGGFYRALLISPQSGTNLKPAVADALASHIPLVNVDGALVDGVTHFVGPVNRTMGARVGAWFATHSPVGGAVAVIEGQAGVLSTVQRTAGFRDAVAASGRLHLVPGLAADWDRKRAYEAALSLLRTTPDLVGLYCNNDVMALGAVEAVKHERALGRVRVFGTDGTSDAFASIRAGDLTGTVDMFPMLIGSIALDVAERLSVGQTVPHVIETPQALVTRDNVDRITESAAP